MRCRLALARRDVASGHQGRADNNTPISWNDDGRGTGAIMRKIRAWRGDRGFFAAIGPLPRRRAGRRDRAVQRERTGASSIYVGALDDCALATRSRSDCGADGSGCVRRSRGCDEDRHRHYIGAAPLLEGDGTGGGEIAWEAHTGSRIPCLN